MTASHGHVLQSVCSHIHPPPDRLVLKKRNNNSCSIRMTGPSATWWFVLLLIVSNLCPALSQGLPNSNADVTSASSTYASLQRSYLLAQQLRQQLQQQVNHPKHCCSHPTAAVRARPRHAPLPPVIWPQIPLITAQSIQTGHCLLCAGLAFFEWWLQQLQCASL